MPQYEFICLSCGNELLEVRSYDDSQKVTQCGGCGGEMRRNFQRESINAPMDYSGYHVSESLFVHPEQEAEHAKHFPDVKIMPDGSPAFDSPKQRSNYLEKRGIYKCVKGER